MTNDLALAAERDQALSTSAKDALEELEALEDVLKELRARIAVGSLDDAYRAELADATGNLVDGIRYTLAVAAW
jgi:predicted ribonuclease toxin of YeeF-YezG toxin-antitoxin module